MSDFGISFDFNEGDLIEVWAKPNSSKSVLEWDGKFLRFNAFLHSIPDDGKANAELVKLFKKQLKLRVELVKGHTSRSKVVRVL